MPIVFEEFLPTHIPAVLDFNRRLQGVLDSELQFPSEPRISWLPKGDYPRIYQEAFLAVEGSAVRGGYILKRQPFAVNGEEMNLASYRLPVSEGIANRAYAMLGLQMLRDVVRRQPMLFSLGMGSADQPLPKMQKSLGWVQCEVPFYFRVVHGGAFLLQIQPLRRSSARRLALNLAAYSGAGTVGSMVWRWFRPASVPSGITLETSRSFGPWADSLWSECRTQYSLVAVRDSGILTALYPPGDPRFLCWRLLQGSRVLGWVVCLDTKMKGHKQFGDLRVGTIVDGLTAPETAPALIAAATRELEKRGVDLIITNQAHRSWVQGLRAAGFIQAPSNFIFSASKQLGAALTVSPDWCERIHINRGDGDGPIHL